MQPTLFDSPSRSSNGEQNEVRRALDDLFLHARQYNASEDFLGLMRFAAKLRGYSAYDAMLVHVQKPGATFVAPAYRWRQEFKHRVKPGVRPLVILQPMGPVMFVFDAGDVEPEQDAPPLPKSVTDPFKIGGGSAGDVMPQTYENATRDGVAIAHRGLGPGAAGWIATAEPGLPPLRFLVRMRPYLEYINVQRRYDLVLKSSHSLEAEYATIAHELAHLHCGHLGTPNPKWWPDRQGIDGVVREFEAESVSYLVCQRLGIDNPSHEYLAGYVSDHSETPPISLDCVMKAAGLIEQMGRHRLKPRGAERG